MMLSSAIHPAARRGFTLVELILAVTVSVFIFSAVFSSLDQLTSAREISRSRMAAYVKADAALNAVRRDITSVLRSDDLFLCKFRIADGVAGAFDRDDLLLFSNRLRVSRPGQFVPSEGMEYEVQYRVVDDERGSVLMQRRDAVPDEYYDGGGIVTPLVEDVISLNVEATDGENWFPTWDSDIQGMPRGVSVEVVVAIHDRNADPVVLRTLISLDRVPPPFDSGLTEEELEALQNAEEQGEGENGNQNQGGDTGGGPINIPSQGGSGGGGGRGGGGRGGGAGGGGRGGNNNGGGGGGGGGQRGGGDD
ncbi:MAG: prepilin-type N-terminal cleavage/methylation domain-containing protein [Phycisphaerales bacterium]